MNKYCIALILALGLSVNAWSANTPATPAPAKINPNDIATYVETTVKVMNVDKDGNVTNSKIVHKNQVLDHGVEGFTQEQIMKKVEHAKKSMPEDKEVSLGVTKEATDFINAAKGGVSSLAGSVASTVGGLISGTVEGALLAIF